MIRAAVGIIKRDNKVLIAKRPASKSYNGYWEFPGGKIEANETGKQALIRELHEELGITVLSAEHWFDYSYSYPDKTVFLEIWQVTEFSGEAYGKENQQIAWATYADLASFRLLAGAAPMMGKLKKLLEKITAS